ncbi:MAG: hypothetical protein CNLJKLNK_00702 [Holosporales bacterium]
MKGGDHLHQIEMKDQRPEGHHLYRMEMKDQRPEGHPPHQMMMKDPQELNRFIPVIQQRKLFWRFLRNIFQASRILSI